MAGEPVYQDSPSSYRGRGVLNGEMESWKAVLVAMDLKAGKLCNVQLFYFSQ